MGKRGRARRRRGVNDEPALPRNVQEVFETAERLLPELQSGADLSEAIAVRRNELRSLMAPFDAVHLLGQLSMGETALDADTYRETEHQGRAYVVELAAAELLTRTDRSGTSAHTPAIDARPLDEVRRLTYEAVLLESFRRYRSAGAFASPEGAARGRAATQNLMVRNPGWPWQEHSVLRGLFGERRFSEVLRRDLGFDAEEAIRLADVPLRLLPQQTGHHMHNLGAPVDIFDKTHPGFAWASASLGGWQQAPAADQARFMPTVWAMNHIGDALLLTPQALAREAAVEEKASTAFLAALSTSFGQAGDENWFAAAERVRYQPYVRVADDTFLLSVPGNDLWALRRLFESHLKQTKAYVVHRGRWLEERTGELLRDAISPDEQHGSVEFSFTDDTGKTTAGEIDQLIRCGDTVITVEAKSATLRPGARRGGDALISHLRETLTKAAQQGTNAREALRRTDRALRIRAQDLALGEEVREVHPVVVTLDDLSSVAPVLWELQGTRVMPEGVTLPWVVTLHELEQICDLIEWPVQITHFLRRRSRLNSLGELTASDELDWWMHYLLYGLYFEDKPAGNQRLLSLTDDLDAWNLWKHGKRSTEAPRPTMNLDGRTRDFLDLICTERPNGWVPAACTLLDASGHARSELWRNVERLRRRASRRNRTQRMTQGYSAEADPFLICAAVVPDEGRARLSLVLERLVNERLDEHGDQRVLGVGVSASGARPYEALLVYESAWWSTPGT